MEQLLFEVICLLSIKYHTTTFFYRHALDPLYLVTVVIKCGEKMVWSGPVVEEKKCINSVSVKLKTNIYIYI